jgi:alpha-beta hydrolase superfamily lysophospholipase
MRTLTRARIAIAALALAAASASAQTEMACPTRIPQGAKCWHGADANGALYLVAIPANWNKVLVVHPHAAAVIRTPVLARAFDDLDKWNMFPRAGYAWAGTLYRRAGYSVATAAEDAESLRRIFVKAFGAPRRTVIHGQGWGANVAAKAIELYPKSYDGALLTSGYLAGATRGHDDRIDLGALFEYYCGRIPPDPRLTAADVRLRLDDCTGSALPAPQRSEKQKRNLADLLATSRVPERMLVPRLAWATLVARDISDRLLDGRNPFTNEGVEYRGSRDDRALNAGVPRLKADPAARARLAEDGDFSGRLSVPVMTLHAIGDPLAYVEHEAAYRAAVEKAGASDKLLQVFTREKEHDLLNPFQYEAALDGLLAWIDSTKRPASADIAAACEQLAKTAHGDPCLFDGAFQPQPWESRVYPRPK